MFSHSSFPYCCTLACFQQAEQIHAVLRMAVVFHRCRAHRASSVFPITQWLGTLSVMCFLHARSNQTPASCGEKEGSGKKTGVQTTPKRRLFPERSKFIFNRSTQRQMYLCYTALVPVKTNQFDSDEVQPMHLHPGDVYLQRHLPKKERKRQTKLTT